MTALDDLTLDSGFDEVADAIIGESIRRGHARDETIAEVSSLIQESRLNPRAHNPAGPWDGIAQQDDSYPGRGTAAGQIRGFLDRLEPKRRGRPGASGDPFKNIFWLQQAPNRRSADEAYNYPTARRAYYDEIRRHIDQATELYDRFAPTTGGNVIRPNPGHRGDPLFLPELLRAWGLEVREIAGWRERGHGDFGVIWGIVAHHTGNNNASAESIAFHPELGLASQLHLAQSGVVTMCGVGQAWHAGAGSWPGIATNGANQVTIGIEAANDGGGSPGKPHRSSWPDAQYEAYTTMCAAILWYLGHGADRLIGHKDWAGPAQGKWDPGAIDMRIMRADVQRKIDRGPTGTAVTDEIEEMLNMPENAKMLREVWDKLCAYPEAPEVGGRWRSRARCRRDNGGVDDTVGMVLYEDANIYDLLTAWSAVEVGDAFSVETIELGAAGKLPANDAASVQWFKAVKRRVDMLWHGASA